VGEVPPPPPPPTEGAAPAPAPAPAAEKATLKYEFATGAKNEAIAPCTHGSASADKGKIEVTTEDNALKAVLTGGVGANVFLGAHSSASQTIQVVQEFDITCSDPSISQVVLTLESNLVGIIRSKHKATACVRLASATIAPAGWASTPLSVCYPTYCTSGAAGHAYKDPQEPVKSPLMPLGRYVLQATLVLSAEAGGLLDAHSTAVFTPESEEIDALEREHDPFKGDKHDDYGFTLTLKADSPPGGPQVVHKKPAKPKKVASRNRAAQASR
jgi:hypothetical protein